MFVLLEHSQPTASASAARDTGAPAHTTHWDLMVEIEGEERLPTWRLARNPIGAGGEIAAERIGDHRRRYLDFEGDIGGDRGRVRRLDRGAATIEHLDGPRLRARLSGEHLRGVFEISTDETGMLVFWRAL